MEYALRYWWRVLKASSHRAAESIWGRWTHWLPSIAIWAATSGVLWLATNAAAWEGHLTVIEATLYGAGAVFLAVLLFNVLATPPRLEGEAGRAAEEKLAQSAEERAALERAMEEKLARAKEECEALQRKLDEIHSEQMRKASAASKRSQLSNFIEQGHVLMTKIRATQDGEIIESAWRDADVWLDKLQDWLIEHYCDFLPTFKSDAGLPMTGRLLGPARRSNLYHILECRVARLHELLSSIPRE